MINDDDFYSKINQKYNKYVIPKKRPTFKEICFPEKYNPQIQQLFLPQFINPSTNYKGMLFYHRIGAGKTCSSIRVALNFIGKMTINIVLPASLKENF